MGRKRVPASLAGDTNVTNRQTKDPEGERSPAERFRRLVESWMAEDPAYAREAWPELKESLDRNRPEHREHFPEDGSKAGRRQTCPRRQTRDQ